MITSPVVLAVFLLCIEVTVLFLASHAATKKYFDIIPSIFWIYFLPMVASSVGIIDAKSPLYSQVTNLLLPVSLFILLMTVDIKAIFRLGSMALLMFVAGAVGIGLGVIIAFGLFKGMIGGQFWSGFGALSGSWTGGSANMIAVKEALGTPDAVFLPMVVVDTVVPYVWMGLLVILSQHQIRYDRWAKADRGVLDAISQRLSDGPKTIIRLKWGTSIGIITLGIAGAALAIFIAGFLPEIKSVITKYAWTIIAVSTLGIIVSFTKVKEAAAHGSNKIGYFILYFVLTTIGAKASISHIGTAIPLIVAGILIVLIHAVVLLTAAKLLRAPLFLAAVASQANIGGVASAPMVAEIYQKGFASVGLLLAILGNLVGTYLGIAVGQLCLSMQ